MVRRRQRLSSSWTAPEERSPAISRRAMSLRISTGRSSCASVSRSSALKANLASPSGRLLRSSARTTPESSAPAAARSTLTLSAPAALSAAASASAGLTPPVTTVIGRLSTTRASPATKSRAWPTSTPSVSQTTSTSGVAPRKRAIGTSASVRTSVWGFGFICRSRTRAAPGVSSVMSREGSESGITATPRLSTSARAIRSSAVRRRASQVAAAAQPSSIRSAIGAAAVVVASGGFHKGPAAARITRAASVSRNSVSHHGVLAGVSSRGAMSNNSRVGAKAMRRGRGGTSRSSHHRTGRLKRPISTSGWAKPSGRPAIMRASPVARRRASG